MPKTKATMHAASGHQSQLGASQLQQQRQLSAKSKTGALKRRLSFFRHKVLRWGRPALLVKILVDDQVGSARREDLKSFEKFN